ncbi:MAG: hypothetical protein ACOYM2_18665 [Rectinemataceae bacterium]
MNPTAKYKGHTVEEDLVLLQGETDSPASMVARIDARIAAMKGEMESALKQAKASFDLQCKDNQVDANRKLKEVEDNLKRSRLGSALKGLIGILPQHLDQVEMEQERVQSVVAAVGDSAPERTLELVGNLVDEIGREKIGVWDFERVTGILGTMRRDFREPFSMQDLLFYASMGVNGGFRDSNRDTITALLRRNTDMKDFIEELEHRSRDIRNKAEILDDEISSLEDGMRINWLGSMTDCKILLDFLKKNRYVEAKNINQFIAKHFNFKGTPITAKAMGDLKPSRDGSFSEMADYLIL